MSDSHITHDATDWIRTLADLKSSATRVPRSPVEALADEAKIDSTADSPQAANLELAARIEQSLRATGYLPLRNLHVGASAGIAILRGAVPYYYMKQIAQTAVSGVPGVSNVHNELEVVPPGAYRNAGST